ncbi:hypothetical protein K227x_02500 [Rubripirellula lacrimiformis]|uniref:Uncharacterized protein n=2 Tax=Rubripirellula lacrimiformis TaxID=1930273 RepID=A0A517N417_9BACT|nr:hypothetical protein K227x_02500 [Rubripirellula lacrimiformis]
MLLVCSGRFIMLSRARRALPWTATGVQEHYQDSRFGSDFQRCLRARINESDFDAFAKRLDLTRTYGADDESLPISWTACDATWWTPPRSLVGARFEHDGDYYAMAAFHDGHVYFVAMGW